MSGKTLASRLTVPARAGSMVAAAALLLGPAVAPAAAARGEPHLFVESLTGAVDPTGMTAGPGGTVWFVSESSQSIVRIGANGLMKAFTGNGICDPSAIAEGPDKALWFDNGCAPGSVGRMTTNGKVTDYTKRAFNDVTAITAGPDGAIWFTDSTGNSIGRITTAGTVTISGGKGVARPMGVAETGSTTMWFTEYRSNMMSEGSRFTRGLGGATASLSRRT